MEKYKRTKQRMPNREPLPAMLGDNAKLYDKQRF